MQRCFLGSFMGCFGLAILFFTGIQAAAAQDQAWLQNNKKTDPVRYEGVLDQPNARREYDVLAFLAFTGTPPARIFTETPQQLHVYYCPITAAGAMTTATAPHIEVRKLGGSLNYLMKAAPAAPSGPATKWADFAWPTAAVISKQGIDPNQLGVVIHLGEDNNYASDLAPAYFSAKNAAPDAAVDFYSLTLRIQLSTLDSLSYQVTNSHGEVQKCYYQNELRPCTSTRPTPAATISVGSVIRLPIDLSRQPAGPVSVRVEGKYHDSDELLVANFHFNYRPQC